MLNSKVFAGGTEAERRNSGLSPLPPLRGGERGKSLPGENLDGKPADDDRQQWLRENLPTVASVVDQFAAAFGRLNLKVAYASEGGHVLGKPGPDGVKLSETLVGPMALAKPEGRR